MTRPRPDYPRNRYEYTVKARGGINRRFSRLADAASYAGLHFDSAAIPVIVIKDKITKQTASLHALRNVKRTARAMREARNELFGGDWPWNRSKRDENT